MNIAFAKLGKSIKFSKKSYSPIGGDNEASCVLRAMANNNPNITFYIVGRSDFSRLSNAEINILFPHRNVVDCWNGIKVNDRYDYINHLINWYKNSDVTIDHIVMMVGQVPTISIPGKIKKINESGIASVIDMGKKYTSPIIAWMNENRHIPYTEIINDPRCVLKYPRDLFEIPKRSLSQYDGSYTTKRIRSYEDQTHDEYVIHYTYEGVETAFCIDYEYPREFTIEDRNIPMMIVLNQGDVKCGYIDGVPTRYHHLKEWILDYYDDISIYGNWTYEKTFGDSRFKGSLHISEIQKKLSNVKYTFIIPILSGWATSKYIEMLHAGVIPFFHPTYDSQKHINVPDILRPSSPKEMQKTISYLEKNPKDHLALLEHLRKNVLKKEYYTGEFINHKIMSTIIDGYVQPKIERVNTNDICGFFK